MSKSTLEIKEKLDNIVREEMASTGAIGLAVSIVDANGNTLYEKCSGYRDKEKGLPIEPDTIFGIASVTKSFTALSIMQLAEKGLLDIHDPVCKYIPGFNAKDVTIAHFLSNSGGFFPQYRILIEDVAEKMGLTNEKDGDLAYSEALADEGERLIVEQLNAETKFTGRPGERYSYGNDGFGLVGAIIKKLGNEKTHPEYLEKNILEPLGMTRSSCNFLFSPEETNATMLYAKLPDGEMKVTDNYYDFAMVVTGGGCVRSTINDMKKYIQMYLNYGKTPDGGRIVQPCSIREIIKPRVMSGISSYYGFGVYLHHYMDDMRIIGHNGARTGVASNISFSYEAGLGVVVLCNTSGTSFDSTAFAEKILKAFRGKVYIPLKERFTPVVWSQELMDNVCGEYKSGEGAEFKFFKKEGQLAVKAYGGEYDVTPINPYMLFLQTELLNLPITIYQDDAGKVWAVGASARMIPRVD